LSFDRFLLPVEILRRHVIRSSTDVAESSISLLTKDFGFEGGRLRRFERREVCMGRRMKMIRLFELLALEIHKFALRFILHQVHFNFFSDLILEFCLC